MNNRIPIAILMSLVLVALVWRVANPPAPPPPGPLGGIPTWDSRTAIGDMAASAVNPAGTRWAGAWNEKTQSGKLASAILVIDLDKPKAFQHKMKPGSFISSLSWADDDSVRALLVDSDNPEMARTSRIAYVRRAGSDKPEINTVPLKEPVARILAWPAGSDKFVAQLAGTQPTRLAVMAESGEIVGKPAPLDLAAGTSISRRAAISQDGKLFVFSIAEDKVGGKISYHIADSDGSLIGKPFSSAELPGRVDGIWISPAGVLMVCAEREKIQTVVYRLDTAQSVVTPVSKAKGVPIDIAKSWPDAPKTMMFATYNGGYELTLANGKVKRLFDFSKQDKYSDQWRRQVQDGRVYPRKDGDYTSISVMANEVDIRVIKKSGDKGQDILPRS